MKKLSALFVSGLFVLSAQAHAAQFLLTDCAGVPQAAQVAEQNTAYNLTVDVAVPDGSKLVITNTATQHSMTSTVKNAKAEFDHIAAGTWKACAQDQALTIKNIALEQSGGTSIGSLSVAGAGILGGVAALVSLQNGNDGDSSATLSDVQLSSGSVPVSEAKAVGARSSGASVQPATTKPRLSTRECEAEEEPEPVSPIS